MNTNTFTHDQRTADVVSGLLFKEEGSFRKLVLFILIFFLSLGLYVFWPRYSVIKTSAGYCMSPDGTVSECTAKVYLKIPKDAVYETEVKKGYITLDEATAELYTNGQTEFEISSLSIVPAYGSTTAYDSEGSIVAYTKDDFMSFDLYDASGDVILSLSSSKLDFE